jgi:hypothetical protein
VLTPRDLSACVWVNRNIDLSHTMTELFLELRDEFTGLHGRLLFLNYDFQLSVRGWPTALRVERHRPYVRCTSGLQLYKAQVTIVTCRFSLPAGRHRGLPGAVALLLGHRTGVGGYQTR